MTQRWNRIFFPIEDFPDRRSKFARIVDGLNGPASQGRLYVRQEDTELISQFARYPRVPHDDVLEVHQAETRVTNSLFERNNRIVNQGLARVYEGLERGLRFIEGFLVPDFISRWEDIALGRALVTDHPSLTSRLRSASAVNRWYTDSSSSPFSAYPSSCSFSTIRSPRSSRSS